MASYLVNTCLWLTPISELEQIQYSIDWQNLIDLETVSAQAEELRIELIRKDTDAISIRDMFIMVKVGKSAAL